ncbi:MAG: Eco57I restriction-modification methylase domain-containing protein [Candidatus Gastranaerophilales bacterium]|nr:Eco57I restriction-modification methylase domain-containing protein [Candidatus Gastranaerophilales bacterium]
MTSTLNKKIIEDIFNSKYDETQFKKFIGDLFVGANFEKEHRIQISPVYSDFIVSAKRLCKYKYSTNEYDDTVIDVLAVNLKRTSSLDRARTAQRNFIARYLNGGRDYQKDAALVVFYSKDENNNIIDDWRLSLVKMDYVRKPITDENGNIKKIKTDVELTPSKRFSFLIEKSGEKYNTHTVQNRFLSLLEKSTNGIQLTIEDLIQAFDIEKVSKEFFDEYKKLYIQMCEDLKRLCSIDTKVKRDFETHNIIIEDFAKKTMGQLVFLYFIQKKGWLGVERDKNWGSGDKNFMHNIFYKNKKYCEYNNFFNDVLEHLFYEALASDRGQGAWFDKLNCRIPFLNGGLFEPVNGYEYQKTDLTIDNNLFKEIFDTFDLYNFTVKEDEPLEKEVAIDPEMLGKVFENLLPENIRKGNGSFYTPREIVHYMCQESLINYLYNKLNIKTVELSLEKKAEDVFEEVISKEDISAFIKKGDSTYKNDNVKKELPKTIEKYANELDEALRTIKVCDPAIGSGAFPVGMMNEIVRARSVLSSYIGMPDRGIYELKRNAIENSIYGVDIDGGAVEIAKLRFWLSLVVDEEDIKNIKPLPNLDYKIMQGNSLITSYEGIDFDEIVDEYKPNTQLAINLWGDKSQDLKLDLKNKQSEFLKTPYATRKIELKKEIENIIVDIVKEKLEIKAKEGKLNFQEVEDKIRNFAQNTENRNFFPWKLFFGDAFEQGGFDVVIGNPPYIDSEEMVRSMPKEREMYANKFSSAKGNWDLFIIFCELSLLIGRERSINSFIIPNKILAAKYSEEIRKIFKQKTIIEIRDYSRINVFKEAAVYPIVYVLKNSSSFKNDVLMTKINESYDIANQNIIIAKTFYNDILWDKYFQDDNSVKILIKVSANKSLSTYKEFNITAAATVNEAYLIKEVLEDSNSYDDNTYCKFVNSGTIDKYKILWGIKPMQYIKGRYVNPIIKKENIDKISKVRLQQANSPKIIIASMTKEIEAFYDSGKCLAAKSTTIICGEDERLKCLTGLLNSKLLSWWYKINYNSLKMSGEALGFGSNEVGSIPICDIPKEQINKINSFIDNILELTLDGNFENNAEKQQVVKNIENQIDIMVYKLYDLTYQEVLTIDKDFTLSEEEYNCYEI